MSRIRMKMMNSSQEKPPAFPVARFRDRFPRALVFAANGFQHQIDAGGQSAFVILLPKMRLDVPLVMSNAVTSGSAPSKP